MTTTRHALTINGQRVFSPNTSVAINPATEEAICEFPLATREQLEEIAKTKQPDLTAATLDAAVRTIAGSARAMGLDVEG